MLTGQLTSGALALGKAVQRLYTEGETDYSLEPLIATDGQDQPIGRIRNGDAVVFCCRRGEREAELTEAFTLTDFEYFSRPPLGSIAVRHPDPLP